MCYKAAAVRLEGTVDLERAEVDEKRTEDQVRQPLKLRAPKSRSSR